MVRLRYGYLINDIHVNGFYLVWSPAGSKKDCFFIDDLGKTRQDLAALYKEAKPGADLVYFL